MRYNTAGKTLVCELMPNEVTWLRANQPRLIYLPSHGKVYGYFSFCSQFENCEQISDTYEIAIDFNSMEFRGLPKVYEVGGRIRKVAKLYNLPLCDLHQYDDNRLCLIRPDVFINVFEKRPFTIQLLTTIINSFLYWQSHYERYGCAPWPAEEHGWDWLNYYFKDGRK